MPAVLSQIRKQMEKNNTTLDILVTMADGMTTLEGITNNFRAVLILLNNTLARLVKTARQHLDIVIFMVSFDEMFTTLCGSGRTMKSSPGNKLLSCAGLVTI